MATPIEPDGVQGTEPTGESSPGLNPAWETALSAVPEQFHSVLTPHFQEWDQAAQKRIEDSNAKLSSFEAYQPFVDNGISAQDLEQGMQLMYQLNTNPQAVYNALQEAYGDQWNSGVVGEEEEGEEEEAQNFQDPRYDNLQQGLELVAQTILSQQQEKLEQEASVAIDAEIEQLKQSHPGINEAFVLPLMIEGFDLKQIGERWDGIVSNILQQNPRPFAPSVMGQAGGTGLPSQAVDPTKLSGKETRSLVQQMLAAANNEP